MANLKMGSPANTLIKTGLNGTILETCNITQTQSGNIQLIGINTQLIFPDGTIQTTAGSQDSGLRSSKVTITSAQILQSNTTPIIIVSAPGIGYAIDLISAEARIATYGGTPYATNTTLLYIIDTATVEHATESRILASTVTRITKGSLGNVNSFGATDTQLLENKALTVKANSGNPTAGNSDIIIYITYKLITL